MLCALQSSEYSIATMLLSRLHVQGRTVDQIILSITHSFAFTSHDHVKCRHEYIDVERWMLMGRVWGFHARTNFEGLRVPRRPPMR